jgi:hypothetical protein
VLQDWTLALAVAHSVTKAAIRKTRIVLVTFQ